MIMYYLIRTVVDVFIRYPAQSVVDIDKVSQLVANNTDEAKTRILNVEEEKVNF